MCSVEKSSVFVAALWHHDKIAVWSSNYTQKEMNCAIRKVYQIPNSQNPKFIICSTLSLSPRIVRPSLVSCWHLSLKLIPLLQVNIFACMINWNLLLGMILYVLSGYFVVTNSNFSKPLLKYKKLFWDMLTVLSGPRIFSRIPIKGCQNNIIYIYSLIM